MYSRPVRPPRQRLILPPIAPAAPPSLLAWAVCTVCTVYSPVAQAQAVPPSTDAATSNTALPEIRVRSTRPDVELPADKPVTRIDKAELQRRQVDNIFEVLKDVPGVSVAGGPRASGMRFNLRGFSDNEDVLFKIDGAVKGFEKYRFGGGVFIEPELLKTIEVERGPSVTSGSGALGGTVSATTRSASDFLRRGERAGALAKMGYGWNNHEKLRMLSVFARPNEKVDLLASKATRDSDDIKLPSGQRLDVSATHSDSTLLKLGFFPTDRLSFELSRVAYEAGPERATYDATGGSVGVGGIVRRMIDDETVNLRMTYSPDSPWIKLRGTLAREKTHLKDDHVRGESTICVSNPRLPLPQSRIVYRCTDQWQYDIVTAELFNDMQYRWGDVKGMLTLGMQDIRNERDVARYPDKDPLQTYPNGYNSAQPPGAKHSRAFIAENTFSWRDWSLTPGARWDHYTVSARGETRVNMAKADQDPDIAFRKMSPAAALSWRPSGGDWTLTYRYNETFRPPLLDEYFAQAGFGSRCGRTDISPYDNEPYSPPGNPLYDAVNKRDLAPLNGICGDLYRPQEAVNREITLAWVPSEGWAHGLTARMTLFRMNVKYTLDSLAAVNGQVDQPGTESRHGAELEANYQQPRWFATLSHARVAGRIRNKATGVDIPLHGVPGDTTVLSTGGRWLQGRVEAGWRLRVIGKRDALTDAATVCNSAGQQVPGIGYIGTQYGSRLQDLFASWQVTNDTVVRATLDNATNETYCLVSSFAGSVGTLAAGRSARVTVSMQF